MKGLFLLLELQQFHFAKTPKFSGYTRHHKDHGSLGTEQFPDEMFSYNEKVDESERLFQVLSVGEFTTAIGTVYILPDDETKKFRNGPSLSF
jgi:hypothetical protein